MLKKLELKLNNWRCFSHQDFVIEWQSQILIDNNGSGKTSLLSAIYTLLTSRPWPNTKFKESIKSKTEYFGISTNNPNWFVTGKFSSNARLVTKFSCPNNYDFENSKVLTYIPNDNTWFFESRTRKLSILDNLLIEVHGLEYEKSLKKLNKFAASKLKLIKHTQETQLEVDTTLLNTLNQEILNESIKIWKTRKSFLKKIQTNLKEFSTWINSEQKDWKINWEVATLDGSRKIISLEEKESEMSVSWDKLWQKELIVGKVLYGAQRDDIKITCESNQIQSILSRGEMRTFVLFTKNIARKILKNYNVIWLLDDIFNELDDEREQKIFQKILQKTDTFIATGTKKPKFDKKVKILSLEKLKIK